MITEINRTAIDVGRMSSDASRMIPYIVRTSANNGRMAIDVGRTITDACRTSANVFRMDLDERRMAPDNHWIYSAGTWMENTLEWADFVLFCMHFKISGLKFVF